MPEYLINSEAEGVFWNTMKKEGVPSHHQEFDHDTYIAIIHSMEEYARMILEREIIQGHFIGVDLARKDKGDFSSTVTFKPSSTL